MVCACSWADRRGVCRRPSLKSCLTRLHAESKTAAIAHQLAAHALVGRGCTARKTCGSQVRAERSAGNNACAGYRLRQGSGFDLPVEPAGMNSRGVGPTLANSSGVRCMPQIQGCPDMSFIRVGAALAVPVSSFPHSFNCAQVRRLKTMQNVDSAGRSEAR